MLDYCPKQEFIIMFYVYDLYFCMIIIIIDIFVLRYCMIFHHFCKYEI